MNAKIRKEILNYFCQVFQDKDYKGRLSLKRKSDSSLVSVVDHHISDLIKREVRGRSKTSKHFFLSEEEWGKRRPPHLTFPAVILDPVDGTKEMAAAIPECAVSLAIMADSLLSHEKNQGWIFNPFTGFEITASQKTPAFQQRFPGPLFGMVSRTEWEEGLFAGVNGAQTGVQLSPRGSIAFKLGLLAAGSCDFICSLRPKNIWDIAGGTLICHRRGFSLYEGGRRVERLDRLRFRPPLVWCREGELALILKSMPSLSAE